MSNFAHPPRLQQKLTSAPYPDELEAAAVLLKQSQQPGFEFGMVDPRSPTEFVVITYYLR